MKRFSICILAFLLLGAIPLTALAMPQEPIPQCPSLIFQYKKHGTMERIPRKTSLPR